MVRVAFAVVVLFALVGIAGAVDDTDPEPPGRVVKTPSGLRYEEVTVGKGAVAKKGDKVQVHYTGWLSAKGKKGQEFDTSRKRNQPFTFIIGGGQVIAGWEEGVAGIKVGGKRLLHIPAKLGYGARGAGSTIPPDADLLFEIELVKIGP